jgi:hypothetical protein
MDWFAFILAVNYLSSEWLTRGAGDPDRPARRSAVPPCCSREEEGAMVPVVGLSDLEFYHICRTCSHVRFDDYPSHVLRHILVEVLKKRAPKLAAKIHRFSRLELEVLLRCIKRHLAALNSEPEAVRLIT